MLSDFEDFFSFFLGLHDETGSKEIMRENEIICNKMLVLSVYL